MKICHLIRDEHYLQIMGSNADAPSAYKSIDSKPFPVEFASLMKSQRAAGKQKVVF